MIYLQILGLLWIPKRTHSKFEVPSNVKSFQFDPITLQKVFQELLQLKFFKACGTKNIPIRLYKSISPLIAPLLSDNFNKCFEAAIFSTILKKAKELFLFLNQVKKILQVFIYFLFLSLYLSS